MTDLVFQHPDRIPLAVGVGIVALGLVLWGYRKSPLPAGRKLAAITCKSGAWFLLALCLPDPVWTRKQPKTGENEVILVADTSASLNTAESKDEPTRAARLQAALHTPGGQPPAWVDELSKMFRVRLQTVNSRLQSVTDFGGLKFDGERSELNRAVTTLRGNPGGNANSRVAAVVLLSDGEATDAAAPAEASASQVPVFAVQVADKQPEPDLRLVDHSISQTAFEDTPVIITAQIIGRGFAGKEAAVAVLDEEGRAVVTEKVRLAKDGVPQAVRLRVPAAKPGVSFFKVVAAEAELAPKLAKEEWKPHAKEASLTNNERLVAVDRGSGPYRILYISGRPNWEYKFLRRALTADDEVQMPSLIRIAKREPKFEWRGRTGETSNPLFRGFGQQGEAQRYDQPVLIRLGTKDAQELGSGFPKSPEELFGGYRAVIIDDLEAAFFSQEQMHLLERFVSERGGALLMLGGQESYQTGGYEHTPVGRMLPVYLDRISRASAVEDGRFNLTREGWLEPWTRLRPNREEDEQRLAQMPGFYAVNQVMSIKPGASVLATLSTLEQESLPALAAQRFGEGRVAALTVADLWRWGMKDETSSKDLERAWRQLMRWLVVDVPDRVQLTALTEEGRIKLEARVRGPAFQPLDDASVKLVVTGPDGQKSTLHAEPSLKEAGLFEAEYFPRLAGAYRAEAEVRTTRDDAESEAKENLTTKNTGWVHDPAAAEHASLTDGEPWMKNLASQTGGQLLKLEDLPRLPELLKDIRVPVEETVTSPLWHTPWFYLAALGLLGGEWFLRRKGGMA